MYAGMIIRSLSSLPRRGLADRKALYEKIAAILLRTLERATPPYDEDSIDLEERVLRHTIKVIELDVRNGVNVFASGYAPEGLEGLREKIREHQAARRRYQERQALAAAREADRVEREREAQRQAAVLAEHLHRIDRGEKAASHGRIIFALLLRNFRLIGGQGRLAIFWLLLEPAFMTSAIMIGYVVSGSRLVMGMEVAAFALSGVLAWTMFRQTAQRCANAYVTAPLFLNLPLVRPIHCAFAEAIQWLIVFSVALPVVFVLGYWSEFISQPVDDLAAVAFYWGLIWALGLAAGLVYAGLLARWRFAARLLPTSFRVLMFASSVFFVSDQLPADLQPYVLWNPLAHALELLRTNVSVSYNAQNADLVYTGLCLAAFAIAAATIDRTSTRLPERG